MSLKTYAHCSDHALGSRLLPVLEHGCVSGWVEMAKEMITGC